MKKFAWPFFFVLLAGIFTIVLHHTEQPSKQKYDISTADGLRDYMFAQKKARKGKPKYDKPGEAVLEEIALRSVIGEPFSYSGSWKFDAYRQAKTRRTSARFDTLDWEEHGPANVGGRSRVILVDPRDENTWFAGAVGGGVWKTTDMGESWESLTDDMPVLSITTLTQCQRLPDVLYAGTGEGFYNYDAVVGDGILKTEDGGDTWTQLSSTIDNINFRFVNRLIVNPRDPNTVLAATNIGVYISTNGGNTWTETFNNGSRVQQIVASPASFMIQYITVNGSGIYRSDDGGMNWTNVTPSNASSFGRIEMGIAPSNPAILYATFTNLSSGVRGFYRSGDEGTSWTNYGNDPNWLGGQGWYDNALVVDPFDSNHVYVGGIDIYEIDVDSIGWDINKLTNWYATATYPYVHADQHFFTTIPDTIDSSFALIAANDGGIHYSADMGITWDERNNGYNVTQFYDSDRHPGQSQFIGGTQDNGTNLSPSQADHMSPWTEPVGGDGFDCAWSKQDANVLYATLYSTRIYKSTDGGNSFYNLSNGLPTSNLFHTPLAMDPENNDRLYTAGDGNSFYRTSDGGESWNYVNTNYGGFSRKRITVSLSNPEIVWTASTTSYINVSTDFGASFTQVSSPNGAPWSTPTGINTHPSLDSTAFITFGVSDYGKIFRTDNLGATWTDITGDLPDIPVHTLLVMPYNTDQLLAGTDIGLFISNDSGVTWSYSDHDLPAVSIRRLKIIDQSIVATTHGRGIFSAYDENLPPLELPVLPPIMQELGLPVPGEYAFKVRFSTRGDYDSVHVYINGDLEYQFGYMEAYQDTFVEYDAPEPATYEAIVVAFSDSISLSTDPTELTIYDPVALLDESFADLSTNTYGDLSVHGDPGFATPSLHSDHPYGDNQTYTQTIGEPIEITDGAEFSYYDVAIVEPGESGSEYPDNDMWDYVTVEYSLDGETWSILVTPYDCRFDPVWQSTYYTNGSGSESELRQHVVDLDEVFEIGTLLYLRFRLFADSYVNGWGWAIDNISITNSTVATERDPQLVHRFALHPAYPNPFNSQTRFEYSVSVQDPVYLTIYDIRGRLVRILVDGERKSPGTMHTIDWNGRNNTGNAISSGAYFVQLNNGRNHTVQKVMYLK